jgi:flagellar export protein FliJ
MSVDVSYYFSDTNQAIRGQKEKIRVARVERDKARQDLVQTRKEIKTYDKLRDSQYQQYLMDQKIEEEKVMGDLVSFRAAAK